MYNRAMTVGTGLWGVGVLLTFQEKLLYLYDNIINIALFITQWDSMPSSLQTVLTGQVSAVIDFVAQKHNVLASNYIELSQTAYV